MFRVKTTVAVLHSRGNVIAGMLKGLSGLASGPAWQPRSTGREYIIGAHAGSPSQSDYRSWRFPTFGRSIHAMYFELWRISAHNEAYLFRAYLSLFRNSTPTEEEEILALHCDPNEPASSAHEIYKRGPHLHLTGYNVPGPHAHIALNRCHLDHALASLTSFTESFQAALGMIEDEVLRPLIE